MRLPCLIVILFAIFTPIKSHATEQILNSLIYNGKRYSLTVDILYPYLEKNGKWKWLGDLEKNWCSALWRGYYTRFEIVNNELILKDIRNCSESLLEKFLSELEIKDSAFKADWFTDSIIIGVDKPFYKDGFLDIYEFYSVLHFEKGILIKDIRIGYKEQMSNELKQIDLDFMEHYLEIEKGDKSEFLTKLKIEYGKKFKEPIGNFEFTIQEIKFLSYEYIIEITRTLNGARVKYRNAQENIKVKLSVEEWLDFIKALSNCCLNKWEKTPSYYLDMDDPYNKFYVCTSSKGKPEGECYEFNIDNAKLTNLEGFKKVMEDMVVKIRKAGGN